MGLYELYALCEELYALGFMSGLRVIKMIKEQIQ